MLEYILQATITDEEYMQGKLTLRQIEKMKMLYESGESIPGIEQRLKIPSRTIYNYNNKAGWRNESNEVGAHLLSSPLEEYERQYLAKVNHIDQVTTYLLGSLGRSPEELSQLDDEALNRAIKGMKVLKMATEITDINRVGVNAVLTKGTSNGEEVNVLPIHIEVSPSEEIQPN